jgi:histidine triad (HIT) family protein
VDCLFCGIVRGEIPADVVYQDDEVMAISDINPQAPHHVLVMTKQHFANVAELAMGDPDLTQKLFVAASRIGIGQAGTGFRLVVNTGAEGGQTVDHVHVHVLAGRLMGWPPG